MKINATIYKKLLAQADEAKEQGFTKLAESIFSAIGAHPADEAGEYTYAQLQEDIRQDMWKVATRLMYYYDIQSMDAVKLDENLASWAADMLTDLETTLGVDEVVAGSLEPKIPGESE